MTIFGLGKPSTACKNNGKISTYIFGNLIVTVNQRKPQVLPVSVILGYRFHPNFIGEQTENGTFVRIFATKITLVKFLKTEPQYSTATESENHLLIKTDIGPKKAIKILSNFENFQHSTQGLSLNLKVEGPSGPNCL